MLVTSTAISPRIASLLRKSGIDLYQAVRKSDAELRKLKGFGESAMREIRKASVHVHYVPTLTPGHVRGCVLVINPNNPPTDILHVLALIGESSGFAITAVDGPRIALERRVSLKEDSYDRS